MYAVRKAIQINRIPVSHIAYFYLFIYFTYSILKTSADITWALAPASMTRSRTSASSIAAMGYIRQLGGGSNLPTERMSPANGGTWATHFSLKYRLYYGCAVKISVNQVFTVSRTQVYVYNVVSGAATKYTSPPTTVSFDILMHKLHYIFCSTLTDFSNLIKS